MVPLAAQEPLPYNWSRDLEELPAAATRNDRKRAHADRQ